MRLGIRWKHLEKARLEGAEKMIDIHSHILAAWGKEPFTEEKLLKRMDELRIERFALLPIGISPEDPYFHFGTEDVLRVYHRHPTRVIPFCNVDPREGNNSSKTDFSWLLGKYKELGCKGLGELTANLYFDDLRCLNLFHYCGKFELPIIFHLHTKFRGSYGLVDEIHLPRLENALKKCPETTFIGHSQVFWSEISGDVTEKIRDGYPKGNIGKEGRVQDLLRRYPNLYGDLSAGSGFNAITRDQKYGYKFLEEFQDKLLFGTDLCNVNQEVPIVDYFRNGLKDGSISKIVYDKITQENARRLLKLDK